MNPLELAQRFPHLTSPAALMSAFRKDWMMPPHLKVCNRALMDVMGKIASGVGGTRLMCNIPFQHSKSELFSRGFPALVLLLFPDTRVVLVAHEDDYAVNQFGAVVREIIETYGPDLGVYLKKDTKSKGEWEIKGYNGGMLCRGPKGGIVGRAAELFVIDDLIRDPMEAMSKTIMDNHWSWYQTVVFSRLRAKTNLVVVGTRWSKNDICGKLINMARHTGEKWNHIKFKAIAEKDDILGRKEGEALWPEQVPLAHLMAAKKEFGRWFGAAWQQEPIEEEGDHFRPYQWPEYIDLGDAISFPIGMTRIIYPKHEFITVITADWATSEKKHADFTAFGVFAIAPDGKLLVLETVAKRYRLEEAVPALAQLSRKWKPNIVGVEALSFQGAMANECRRYPEIPEPRRMQRGGNKSKLQRALPAITMGENHRIWLPQEGEPGEKPWLEEFKDQLASFTGLNDDHDDLVDVLSDGAHICMTTKNIAPMRAEPVLLFPGKEEFW